MCFYLRTYLFIYFTWFILALGMGHSLKATRPYGLLTMAHCGVVQPLLTGAFFDPRVVDLLHLVYCPSTQ